MVAKIIYLYVKNMRIYIFAKCILSACIVVNVCAGYQTRTMREWNKKPRLVLNINMNDHCNETINVKDNIDDVNIRFYWMTVLIFTKAKPCWLTLHSNAFRYVRPTFSIDSSTAYGFTRGNRVEFARKSSSGNGTVPTPGIPSSIGRTMTYTHGEDFVIKAYYQGPLRFQFTMKMHEQDIDGRTMRSGGSRRIAPKSVTSRLLNMKKQCGKIIVVEKHSRPIEVFYTHGEYSRADCRLIVRNEDGPFNRISLQFMEFADLNGFCIYASNFEAVYNGARFCSGNPPNVNKVYTSLIGKRGFELRVNGSGSAFLKFRILLTTFHTGECHSQTCGNGRCVPRSQLCKGAYPCGDGSDCYNPRAPQTNSADHLIIVCCVATALALLIECCWRMQMTKAKEEARHNRNRATRTTRATREREVGTTRALTESSDHRHAAPSAPPEVDIELAAARASPSAPPPPAPKSDLPPSYDEVISAGAKYAVNQDPVPSK